MNQSSSLMSKMFHVWEMILQLPASFIHLNSYKLLIYFQGEYTMLLQGRLGCSQVQTEDTAMCARKSFHGVITNIFFSTLT